MTGVQTCALPILNTDKLEATYSGAMNSLTGGSSITTVSSTTGITTGLWKATVIGTAYGGTGSTSTTYCSLTANVSGILPIANGGTGTANGVNGGTF